MDLRAYYRKIREAEAELSADYVVTISLATSEGGKAGVPTEAPRSIAARLLAEGRARVATPEEADAFHELHRVAREKHAREEAARRLQVMVIQPQEADSENGAPPERRKQRDRS
jgi:hypothetical protein